MSVVDRAIYRDGRRIAAPDDLAAVAAACRVGDDVAWIALEHPSEEEFAVLAREFGLHPLAVEDAVHAHQRAKLEVYGDGVFLVLRPARYDDATETVEFGELHVFAGPRFVVTVRHAGEPGLERVRAELEARPELLRRGPFAIVHAILDRVVDDYAPVAAGIENDIDEIEDEVFGTRADPSRRIYELTREVIALQRATGPLGPILERLARLPGIDEEERRYLADVHDHALRLQEQVAGFRELLGNILHVNLTRETAALSEAANRTGDEVKRISSWAAILFAPTLVGTIYGMNFEHMPELRWVAGYPLALTLMLTTSVVLYIAFRRRGWL